jgi:NADPH:quinone reductase-like Zn-dependent oxidoreductase
MSLIQLVETSKTEAIPAPFPNTKGTVTIKVLNSDQSFGPAVAVLRMEPGSEIPRHLHEQTTETSYVLDGDFINEGTSYPKGTEFNIKPNGAHGPHTTKTGCSVLVMFSYPSTFDDFKLASQVVLGVAFALPASKKGGTNADEFKKKTRREQKCPNNTGRRTMKAIVVTDQAAGPAGVKLVERPEPQAAWLASLSGANYGDVVVRVHASGFTGDELSWPSTWTDRVGRDRTPSIPGHELAGVVIALGYGTTGLSIGQRVFGLTDWYRDGTLAEYVGVEARNLAPLPGDVDFTVGAALVMPGLTAWQGLFEHGRLRAGQSVLVHGAAGVVGSMATQLAREAGAYVIGTGRAAGRQAALDFGAQEFVDLDNDALEDVGGVDLVFDVIGGDIAKRSAGLIRAGGTLVTITGPSEARPANGLAVDFVVESDRAQLSEIVRRVRDGRLRTNVGIVSTLDDAVAAFNPTKRINGKTIVRVRP